MLLAKHFFRIRSLDVYSTVTNMNSQSGMMMVETCEQYLDIFQCLKDEVTTREVRGYIDLEVQYSTDSEGDDDIIYNDGQNEYNYDTRGDAYYDKRGDYNYEQGASYYYQ